ncbi:hypothetical protein H7Y40_01875 [Pedobacter sp.]|nr:hypothetical protein [Candidatus Saccharibacteria bacterium]
MMKRIDYNSANYFSPIALEQIQTEVAPIVDHEANRQHLVEITSRLGRAANTPIVIHAKGLALLETQEGVVRFYADTLKSGRHLCVEYPDHVRVPDSFLAIAPEAHVGIPQDNESIQEMAVIDGVLGVLSVARGQQLKIERASVSAEARFKELTVAVTDIMGGAKNLSAHAYETESRVLSFDYDRSARVAGKLALLHYDVTEYERLDDTHTKTGFKVIEGIKETARGQETIFAEEVESRYMYSIGAHQWRLTRGVTLRSAATDSGFYHLLSPLLGSTHSQNALRSE